MYLATLTAQTTPQQMFDEIKKGVEANNFPCSNGSICMYRYGGRCCVIGMFLSEERYAEVGERTTPCSKEELDILFGEGDWPEFLSKSPTNITRGTILARRLQYTHDSMSSISDWDNNVFLDRIKEIFSEHGIDVS